MSFQCHFNVDTVYPTYKSPVYRIPKLYDTGTQKLSSVIVRVSVVLKRTVGDRD